MKVMLIQGSPRHLKNCPHEWPKTTFAVNAIVQNPPSGVELDVLDLSVPTGGDGRIQPCKGCVSTSGGFHCHWPCSCYGEGSAEEKLPDLMHDQGVYRRLVEADGFVVLTPIHWYGVPTQVKAMFDRLVCANLTITRSVASSLFGDWAGKAKDPEKTKQAQRSGRYNHYLKNHLEGKTAAFFVHGDAGADDYIRAKKPASYLQAPKEREPGHRCAIRPLVWQCRYSGVVVPEDCIETFVLNPGLPYSDQNDKAKGNVQFTDRAVQLVDRLVNHIRVKHA